MEPIHAVYIKEEYMPEDTEQQDSVSLPVPERSKVDIQQQKLVLCSELSDVSVIEKLQVSSTLSMQCDISNISISDDSCDRNIPIISQSQYSCAVCVQYFSTRDLLLSHVFSHNRCLKSPLYICQYCGLIFSNISKLHTHNFQECKKVSFKEPSLIELACTFCTGTFFSWCSLTKHVFSHISAISTPLYVCKYCSKVFKDVMRLQFHKYNSRTSQRSGDCGCKKSCNAYEQHLSAAEFQTNRIEKELAGTCSFSDSNKNEQNLLKCKSDKQSTMCEMHGSLKCVKCCIGKRLFSCDACRKCFTRSSDLKKHQLTHSGERPFSCDTCGKLFTQSSHLKSHQRIHLGEYPFSCEVCGKSFKQSGHLKSHLRIHFGLRPFTCDICGKSFTVSGHLKSHRRIHSGERPFSCEFCGKSFTESGHLTNHQRIHLGKRPFTCDICGKSFTVSGHLQSHRLIHSGERPFTCNTCGKTFTQSGNLRSHQRIHLGKRPFTCDICGKTFTQSGHLKKHQRIHSG